MSATPTSDRHASVSARLVLGILLAWAAAVMAAATPAGAGDSLPDSGWGAEFYSYLPAAPDLKLPDLDIIPFWTDDLKKAKKAYKNGEYGRARKFFERASDDGNIVADWYLGHMYRLGRGVGPDPAKAFSYYGRVADAFDPDERDKNRLRIMVDAMVRIGDVYRLGDKGAGVAQDFERAIRIYKLAATYGHPAAEHALGLMNLYGQGVKRQPGQGLKWLMKAARRRFAPAEAALGDLYWKGEFVEADRTRAIMWYLLAKATARPEDSPEIFDQYDRMIADASEEERLEAAARADVWAEQFPAEQRNSIAE